MQDNIIEIEGLSKAYGNVQAVKNISFTVPRGSLFSFLGINGAGKSTTINILCSILKKDGGKVTVDGFDLDTQASKIKPNIGIVFQNTVLDGILTVKDNLVTRASYYGLGGAPLKTRLDELCALLNLNEIFKRPFAKLSGGQKRRVDIARGLIHKPKLLILDEPTTGLDPQTRKTVWNILDRERKEHGMSIFLTTHYMEEADESDKVVIIDDGKIAAEGAPVALKNSYSGNYLYLYGEEETLRKQLKEKSKLAESVNGGIRLKMDNSKQAREFLLENGVLAQDFEFVKGNMDDVFLNVTGKRLSGGTQ